MVKPPDITGFKHLLNPIDVGGPERYLYSYVHEQGGDFVGDFLERLKSTDHGRYSHYITAFRMVGQRGYARGEKWHMLDEEKPPRGVAKSPTGETYSLKGMGEFKNVPHQSRIFHCTGPSGLIVLLTVFEEKKENDLTAEAINPALRARDRFSQRRQLASTGRPR